MLNTNKGRYWAVIPAAGIGSRMQAKCAKQYLKLYDGRTVLEHSIAKLQQVKEISGICVCLAPDDVTWASLAPMDKVYSCIGGKQRADSVLKGLQFWLKQPQVNKNDWVLVHDAARPAVDVKDIIKLIKTVAGAILASPVKDTLKRQMTNDLHIAETVDRSKLWQAQTPQMFRLNELEYALNYWLSANQTITDEAQAMEKMGHLVQLVEANPNNIKLTLATDLALINDLCQQQANKK